MALRRAIEVISLEFLTPDYFSPGDTGVDCVLLKRRWNEWTLELLKRNSKHGRHEKRLSMLLKSCKRIFDLPCRTCDKRASEEARSAWDAHVAKDVPVCDLPSAKYLDELRLAARELLSGWGHRLADARKEGEVPVLGEYVPDQQGCYETERKFGGTMATRHEDFSGDWSAVRRGVAKTKGKFRTVTMQSAEVKRVLTPVHNALYNHITSFGWCVRGDVRKEDFEAVSNDIREGESYISGDYVAATDNLYLVAVEVIIDEISKSPELSGLERDVLKGSFRNLRWVSKSGVFHPIKRGSMMGNLISFPLLCLLNKCSFDIACNIRDGKDRSRKGRFNGDDCIFCGDSEFYGTWQSVTKRYGFIVNREKTGISHYWLDLNSQVYSVRGRAMVAKATLGFLRPSRTEPGSMLRSVIVGMRGFRLNNVVRVVNMLRHEISLRGVSEDLGSLGPYWRGRLVKMRWFRAAAMLGGAQVIQRGEAREVPCIVGPPPRARFLDFVTRVAAQLQRDNTKEWTGIKVSPVVRKLDRKSYKQALENIDPALLSRRFSWGGVKWAFVWPKPLYDVVKRFNIFSSGHEEWYQDHPFLTTVPIIFASPLPKSNYPPPLCLLYGVDCMPRFRL